MIANAAPKAFVMPKVRNVAAWEGHCAAVALRGARIHSTGIGGRSDGNVPLSLGLYTPTPATEKGRSAPAPGVNLGPEELEPPWTTMTGMIHRIQFDVKSCKALEFKNSTPGVHFIWPKCRRWNCPVL
jgi:hypothetical protein